MDIRRFAADHSWAFPTDFPKPAPGDTLGMDSPIDTQDIVARATAITEADPARKLFSFAVVTGLETGSLTPAEAHQHLQSAETQLGLPTRTPEA